MHNFKADLNVKLQIATARYNAPFRPKFRGVRFGVDAWCWGSAERRKPLNYFWSIPTYVTTIPQRHRRTVGPTDGRTDGRTDDLL